MRKNILVGFLFVFVLSIALIGCSSDSTANPDTTNGTDTANNSESNTQIEDEKKELVELEFLFPVSVGGAISKEIESYVAEFNADHKDEIKVTAVFSGDYTDTFTKIRTTAEAGQPPDLAILLQTDIFDLTDLDYVEPLNSYIEQEGADFIEDFHPALLAGSEIGEQRYSLPFQRSTQILFYNKEAFKEAGIDKAPNNWNELVEVGKQLVKRDGGKVERWGLQVPMGGFFSYWNFEPFAIQNGVELANSGGTEVRFDDPKTVEALQFFYDLANKHEIMPAGVQGWGDIPTNFLAGTTAMAIHSTGSLTNIKNQAEFEFGVAMLPTNSQKRTNLGGGNLYMFKDAPEGNKEATWEFIKFLTSPEIVARWSIASGYIPSRESALDVPAFQDYIAEFPEALVARDQLDFAGAELTSHNKGRVIAAFSDEIEAVITGQKSPQEAMEAAQMGAERALQGF